MASALANIAAQPASRAEFVAGYFSDRVWAGEQPDYGYPQNHLPETDHEEMVVETGFICALKSGK